MARRARKGVDYTQIIIIAAIVFAVGGMALLLANRTSDPFAGLQPLPVGEFMDNANSLSGSVFSLTGKITEKPRYTPNNGSIIFVNVDHGNETFELPVYVPVEFYGTNLNRGDTITSKVEVRSLGRLALQEIK